MEHYVFDRYNVVIIILLKTRRTRKPHYVLA